jgi:hypothetical protein
VPISQLYTEIYNIHSYFSGPSKAMLSASNATRAYQTAGLATRKLDGDADLRKIASAGRKWMFENGRKIDMESKCVMDRADSSLCIQVVSGMGTTEQR